MGGYVLGREPGEPMSSLKSTFGPETSCSSIYLREIVEGSGHLPSPERKLEEKHQAMKSVPRSGSVISEYENLLPSISPRSFYRNEKDIEGLKSVSVYHPPDDDSHLLAPFSKQGHLARIVIPARSERVTKSRKFTQHAVKEASKENMPCLLRQDLPKTPMSWTCEDDILLRDLKELRRLGWKEIAAHFPQRTAHACQFRWRRLVSGTLKGHKQYPSRLIKNPALHHCLGVSGGASISDIRDFTFDCDSLATGPPPESPPDLACLTTMRSQKLANHFSSMEPSDLIGDRGLPQMSLSPGRTTESDAGGSESSSDERRRVSRIKDKESDGTAVLRGYGPCPIRDDRGLSHRQESLDGLGWTTEEDGLLLNRRLSFDEVSILLHHRSEEAIWARMGILRSSGPRSTKTKAQSRYSVEQFSPERSRNELEV